jgi:hypothetical protein
MNSTAVISLCNLAHIDVWKLTSKLLPKQIKANSFRVYVPFDEVELFRRVTPSEFEVLSQSEFGCAFFESLSQACLLAKNAERFGWYLQQFLKIEILLSSPEDRLVIWDADCVPLKPITTFNSSGDPVYMLASNEYNKAYFENIQRLLGLTRVQDFSFVVPSFPVKKSWLQDLVEELRKRNGQDFWWEAIISSTDFSLRSGFSETETIGTWVANKYAGQWSTFSGSWERRGQKEFGYARNFSVDKLLRRTRKSSLDIVSFENWDVRGIKLVHKRLKEFFPGF